MLFDNFDDDDSDDDITIKGRLAVTGQSGEDENGRLAKTGRSVEDEKDRLATRVCDNSESECGDDDNDDVNGFGTRNCNDD